MTIPSGFKSREEYNAYMKKYNKKYRARKKAELREKIRELEERNAFLESLLQTVETQTPSMMSIQEIAKQDSWEHAVDNTQGDEHQWQATSYKWA